MFIKPKLQILPRNCTINYKLDKLFIYFSIKENENLTLKYFELNNFVTREKKIKTP